MPVILALLIGGVGLIWIERHVVGRSLSDAISWRAALIMGAGQLLAAVFPGTSRSGATILLALLVGLSRKAAVEFTFLLGIPTLLAAGGLEIALAIKDGEWQGEHMGHLILGTLVSAVTAFIAVRWLLRYVQTHNFIAFGWYRIILAVILLLVFMT